MEEDSVMTIAAGGRATVVGSSFHGISVSSETPGTVAAGPVMRLQSRTVEHVTGSRISKGSAAWFTDCTFTNLRGEVPGEVAVEESDSSVFTNQALPTIWHLKKAEEIDPLTVAQSIPVSISGGGGQDVFATVSARLGPLLRSDNPLIRDLVAEQARLTGLQPAVLPQLPTGTDLVLIKATEFIFAQPVPYRNIHVDEVTEDRGTFSFGALVGVVTTVPVLLLVAACCIWRHRKRKAKREASQGVRFCMHLPGRDPHKVIMYTYIHTRAQRDLRFRRPGPYAVWPQSAPHV